MELDEGMEEFTRTISFKCILSSYIGNQKAMDEFKFEENFSTQDVINETANYISLATCTRDIRKIIQWLEGLYGKNETKVGLLKSFAMKNPKELSSRTIRTILTAIIEIDGLADMPQERIEALFDRLSLNDVESLPRSKGPLKSGSEPSLACFKMHLFEKSEISAGLVAKWLGEFKGTTEELTEALEILSKCKFDRINDASLKAVIERMLLRNALNACLVIRYLGLLQLVSEQFMPLLWNETDAVRTAALEAFLANPQFAEVAKKLVEAFNAKGCSLKVKSCLAEALAHCSDSKEARELARTVVTKETNEQIVCKLLPLVDSEISSYSLFKTGKLTMKTVLLYHMPLAIVKEFAGNTFDLIQKESSSSTPESVQFICVALSKLVNETFDWAKFIKEVDSKPTSFLRQVLTYSSDSQCQVIDWLLCDSIPKADPVASKYLTQLAINGHAEARRHLNIKLSSLKEHNLNLDIVSQNIDDSLNSWKLCKSLTKQDKDAIYLFEACNRVAFDWVCLASRVCKNLSSLVEDNFDFFFSPPFDLPSSGLKVLQTFAGEKLSARIKCFITETLDRIESSDAATAEKIWLHVDESTLAIPLVKAPSNAKLDPKVEKAQLEAALKSEKAVREAIRNNLDILHTAARLAPFSTTCEGFGSRVAKHLSSQIYSSSMCKLLYGLGKAWRPLVATCLIRHQLGDDSSLIDRNWNISSLSGMEESIKRLFVQTKPLEPALVFFLPLFIIWIKNEQFDFVCPVADRMEELAAIDELTLLKESRFDLVKALLGFQNRTPDVDRIMACIGGPIASEAEAKVFIEALFSESFQARKTALEALHTVWSLDASLAPELSQKIILLIELLKFDDACMQTATAVSLKIKEIFPETKTENELARDACKMFESKPVDSWVTEATKEYIASLDSATAIGILLENYVRLLKDRRPEIVNVRSKDLDLTKASRTSVVEALGMVTLGDDANAMESLFKTIVTEIFFDPAKDCYESALQSALALIEGIPAEKMERLFGGLLGNLFEAFLSGRIKNAVPAVSIEETDRARVFVIILLGKVSQFMSHDEARRTSLVKTMIETLKTPAENVQCAVAEALVPLFSSRHHHKDLLQWVTPLKSAILQTESGMAGRRGAAYGLAALTKARGLLAVKEWELMDLLLTPLRSNVPKNDANKPTPAAKEGALFGLELLARFLGQSFEPYVMRTIDAVLVGFSDGKSEVREATFDTAKALMGCVSSAGARLLLPALLGRATQEDSNWRSRVGVLEWLGAMASMAPSVLAARLPDIIPVLIETGLNDSHGQVQAVAKKSLIEYGKAVANPEMRSLVPSILEALADPSGSTGNCFRRILETRFSHVIDGPSLALLEPLLRRALTDRSAGAATLKKLSGQIIGNLATSLVDAADFSPYLGTLMPALCACLGDPVPQVRAHAAKVIGMLVKVAELDGRQSSLSVVSGLFPLLETQLLSSNDANTNDIDRAGAGQALAEIMAAKGVTFTRQVLQDQITPFLNHENDSIKKEGGLLILGYLSAAFDFYERLDALYTETSIPELLSTVLDLTADQSESVRNSATKTSKALIEQFVSAGIDRSGIFTRLLHGFGSSKWRVRLTCLGMLEKAMSSFDQQQQEEEDEAEADNVIKVARLPTAEELEASGLMDRNTIQILQTRLYLARFDPASSQLRSTALNLWKGLSYHSPRTLTEILPLLVREVAKPASIGESSEQVERALEDLFVKLGDRLIIPFLNEATTLWVASDSDPEQQISKASILNNLITLVKVMGMKSDLLTRNNFDEANKKIVQAIMAGLAAEDDEVCQYASRLFDALLDEVLTTPEQSSPIIKQIVKESFSDDAILMLVEYKPVQMLSVLIPSILESLPEDEEKLELLGQVFDTAGYEAVSHAIPVLKALLTKYSEADINSDVLNETITAILASLNEDYGDDDDEDDGDEDEDSDEDVDDDDGEIYDHQDTVHHLRFGQLLEAQMEKTGSIPWAYQLVRLYCEGNPQIDHSRMFPIWIPRLLTCCLSPGAESRPDAQQAKPALLALLDSPKTQHLASLIQAMRAPASRLERAAKNGNNTSFSAWHTPIFTQITKMVILPILTGSSSIITSDTEMLRTHACEVTSVLLRLSSSSSATASWGTSALTLLTGALIRVASDRKAGDGRTSTVETLLEALKAHPTALRPFFPQLQRLFAQIITNCQLDSSDDIVQTAIQALAKLVPLLPKPEAMIQEWASILAGSEDGDEAEDNIQRVSTEARVAMLKCLTILFTANPEIGAKLVHLKAPIMELLKMLAAHKDETVRLQNIQLIEGLAKTDLVSSEERTSLLELARMLK